MKREKRKPKDDRSDRATQEAILALLREALFDIPAEKIGWVDWDAVLIEAKNQHIVSLVYAGARRQQMSPETAKRWETAMNQIFLYNVSSQRKHLEVYREVEEAGIPCVILKGIASAAYYPKPLLRGAGDVDFLVHEEDIERGDRVLRGMGLHPVPEAEKHEVHVAYHKRGYHVEMHRQVNGVPSGERGDRVRAALADLFDASEEYTCESGICCVPAMQHHCIILLVHTAGHILSRGTSLRHLCDWAVFAARAGAAFFEEKMQTPLKEMGLWRLAQILTDLSAAYLGLPAQPWAGIADEAYLAQMLADFYAAGYFGRKDPARTYDNAFYLHGTTRSLAHGSMIGTFAGRMNEAVKRNFPITERVPVLIPFGWCFLVGRLLVRIHRGTRPRIRVVDRMQTVQSRRELYSAWHLFEPEDSA